MITLYHAPQTRSVRPRWLLEELGLPYEIVRLNLEAGDQKRADYLKINPNGTVPTIIDGGVVLFESGAICQHLADKDPAQRMAPALGTRERASYYQWIHYAMSGLEPPAVAIFTHTILRPEAERIPAVAEEARPRLAAALDVVERALAGREFIVSDHLTAADVMLGSTAAWAMVFFSDRPRPNLSAYVTRLVGRCAYQRATGDEVQRPSRNRVRTGVRMNSLAETLRTQGRTSKLKVEGSNPLCALCGSAREHSGRMTSGC